MHRYSTLCICGGGGLGHTIAASVSSKNVRVNMLTGQPQKWSVNITVIDCHENIIDGTLNKISDNPADVIPEADIILLCVPGFLVEETLNKISPYIKPEAEIGSVVCSNGFFWIARKVLKNQSKLFGFQRVPFISRVIEYGKTARLKGYKSLLKIGGNQYSNLHSLATFFTEVLQTKTITLHHYLEATLTNSNPILHPARIYGMLSPLKTDIYDKTFLFYEEWDDYSSEVLIRCDLEFQRIISQMPIHKEEIPSLLTYYESTNARSLSEKIRSIKAFQGIHMGMIQTGAEYVIDYSSRYFTEDIPYGLLIIKSIAILLKENTPQIDEILLWMQNKMKKEYLINNKLIGKDCINSGIIQNFDITTKSELYGK